MDILMSLFNKLDVNYAALFLVTIVGVCLLLMGNGLKRGALIIRKNKTIFWFGFCVCIIGVSTITYKTIKPVKPIAKQKYIRIWGWDYEVGNPVIHVENMALNEGKFYFAIAHPHDGKEWLTRKDYISCSVFKRLPRIESHEIFFKITNPKAYPYQERIVFRLFEWKKEKHSLLDLINNKMPLQAIIDRGATLIDKVRAPNDYDIRSDKGRTLFLKTIEKHELREIQESLCNQ